MRKFLLAAVAVLALAAPASASTMDAILANTLVTQGADGAQSQWKFNADGSYTMTAAGGTTGAGTFTNGADGFCITPNGGERLCVSSPPDGKGVGDSWTTQGADGAAINVSIQAGR